MNQAVLKSYVRYLTPVLGHQLYPHIHIFLKLDRTPSIPFLPPRVENIGTYEPFVFRILPTGEYPCLPPPIWAQLQYELPLLTKQRLLFHSNALPLDQRPSHATYAEQLPFSATLPHPRFPKPNPATRLPPVNCKWEAIHRVTIDKVIKWTSSQKTPTTEKMIIPVRCFSCGKVGADSDTSLAAGDVTLAEHVYKLGSRPLVGGVPEEARRRHRGRVSLFPSRISTITPYWLYVGLSNRIVANTCDQCRDGPARLQAILLPPHAHDACGPHRKAPEVSLPSNTTRFSTLRKQVCSLRSRYNPAERDRSKITQE